MKMGRRLRCSSVTSRTSFGLLLICSRDQNKTGAGCSLYRQSGSDRLADGPF